MLVVRITKGTFQSCKLIPCGGLCHLCVSDHPEAVVGPRIDMELRWHSCSREATSILQIFFQKQIQGTDIDECGREAL